MKIYHFTIVFALFASMMFFVFELGIRQKLEEERSESFIDAAVDHASSSAAEILIFSGASGIKGVMDMAVDSFYGSLAAELGLSDTTPAITVLRLYVPIIAVTDGNDVFFCFDRYETNANGQNELIRGWSEAIPVNAEGISEQLEYYCDLHNKTAEMAGIRYRFELPPSDGGLFARGSSGPGFFVLFQGYPVSDISGKVCNSFSFAGTGMIASEQYFINVSGDGLASERYFHRSGCSHIGEESIMFESTKECALHGAFECPDCMGGF